MNKRQKKKRTRKTLSYLVMKAQIPAYKAQKEYWDTNVIQPLYNGFVSQLKKEGLI